jgi:hypothetical protein
MEHNVLMFQATDISLLSWSMHNNFTNMYGSGTCVLSVVPDLQLQMPDKKKKRIKSWGEGLENIENYMDLHSNRLVRLCITFCELHANLDTQSNRFLEGTCLH